MIKNKLLIKFRQCIDNKINNRSARSFKSLVAECFVVRWRWVVKLVGEIKINYTSISNVK